MSVELTQEVSDRLLSDRFAWLTTVANSGQPVPRLVWFYFDGAKLTVYTVPSSAKVAHIKRRPWVSLNLDSDGSGAGIVVVGGVARVDTTDADCRDDEPYWNKYRKLSDEAGLTDTIRDFSARLEITPTKVWTTPTG